MWIIVWFAPPTYKHHQHCPFVAVSPQRAGRFAFTCQLHTVGRISSKIVWWRFHSSNLLQSFKAKSVHYPHFQKYKTFTPPGILTSINSIAIVPPGLYNFLSRTSARKITTTVFPVQFWPCVRCPFISPECFQLTKIPRVIYRRCMESIGVECLI